MTPEQEFDMVERDFYDKYRSGILSKEDIEDMGLSFDKLLEKHGD